MHIITAKIKVFQKPQAFLTIIMINEAIKKQTEDNYYICNNYISNNGHKSGHTRIKQILCIRQIIKSPAIKKLLTI